MSTIKSIYLIIPCFVLFLCPFFAEASSHILSEKSSENPFARTFDDRIETLDSFLKSYTMTDKKHLLFQKENEEYALADTMLNFTWYAVKEFYKDVARNPAQSPIDKVEYKKIVEAQRVWIESGRDAVASSFSLHLSEVEAFTLAIIARTQELASIVSQKPQNSIFLYTATNSLKNTKSRFIQGGHIVIDTVKQDGIEEKIVVSGQSFAKSGNACEIYGECILNSRAEDTGKNTINHDNSGALAKNTKPEGWLSFYPKSEDKALFYALFTENSVYIVHNNACKSCGKGVAFQGLYKKSTK